MTAHLVGVAVRVAAAVLLQPGYGAGAVAMAGTIVLLILWDIVHPPAVSTALGFAFFPQQDGAVGFFLLALVMLAALVVLRRAGAWVVRRLEAETGRRHQDDG